MNNMQHSPFYSYDVQNTGIAVGSLPSPFTLVIGNCDSITLIPKGIDVKVKLERVNFEEIDTIIINGYKFTKEIGDINNE